MDNQNGNINIRNKSDTYLKYFLFNYPTIEFCSIVPREDAL